MLKNIVFFADIGILFATTLVTYVVLQSIEPDFFNERYRFVEDSREENWQQFTHPFSVKSKNKLIEVEMSMRTSWLHPRKYTFIPDDCIQKITINEQVLNRDGFPFCNLNRGHTFDLSSYLLDDSNIIKVLLLNKGGAGKLEIRTGEVYYYLILILYLGVIAAWTYNICNIYMRKRHYKLLALIFVTGFTLRFLYLLGTPYFVRGHDALAHLKYVQYILEYWSIPPLKGGWEFYHPPLYHFLSALWFKISSIIGRSQPFPEDLQVFAFLCSVGVLGISIWISSLLFSKQKQRRLAIPFVFVIAVFPGLIYFSARINNDVLVQLWMFLSIALIFYWWKNGEARYWLLSIFIASLGILTKSSALLLLPIAYLCLFCYKNYGWHKKMKLGCIGLLMVVLIIGLFFARRFVVEGQDYIVGNAKGNVQILRVYNEPEYFVEFNPIRLIRNPYNILWQDIESKHYFFEYFFRSAFFGEFQFKRNANLERPIRYLSSFLLLQALLLLVPMFVGLWYVLKKELYALLPVWITFLVLIAGHLLLRITPPTSAPGQDFRHSTLLVIPCTYFVLTGISSLPKKYVRPATYLLYSFIATCATFIIIISLIGS